MPSQLDLAYTAGLIDGEGCLGIRAARPVGSQRREVIRPFITVAMTNSAPLLWLSEIFGAKVRLRPRPPAGRDRWAPVYVWEISGRKAVEIARLIRPFLKVKADQADLVCSFYGSYGSKGRGHYLPDDELDRRRAAKERMHLLNARGVRHAV